jgi:hypothetical protein
MAIDEKEKKYLSYLLRVWLVRVSGKSVWRGSLEDPFTGERRGFANLRELFIYLTTRIGENDQDTDVMPE